MVPLDFWIIAGVVSPSSFVNFCAGMPSHFEPSFSWNEHPPHP
jgi:hypothetical protein